MSKEPEKRIPKGADAMEIRTTPIDGNSVSGSPTIAKPQTGDAQSNDWARWGEDDNYPLTYLEKLNKSGVALTGIDTNAAMHYGCGLIWVKDEVSENGKLIKRPSYPEGWFNFERKSNFTNTLIQIIHSLETFYIAFVEVIMQKDKKKVAYTQLLDTPFCRKQKKDEKGKMKYVYFSTDFGLRTPEKPDKIEIYNPDAKEVQDKFVLIFEYATYGRNYYPRHNLQSVIDNGWFDTAVSVPKYLKSIYKNQISPKYQVFIPIEYFRFYYKDFDNKPEEERIKLIEEKKEEVEKALVGEENAAKSIISLYDGVKENFVIEVTPLETPLDRVKEKDLPSNAIANAEICTALGIAPALGGITVPGGSNLSGSGSDVRENRKSKQGNLKLERESSLVFASIIARLNGYPDDIYATYTDIDTSETLDQSKEVKPTIN